MQIIIGNKIMLYRLRFFDNHYQNEYAKDIGFYTSIMQLKKGLYKCVITKHNVLY